MCGDTLEHWGYWYQTVEIGNQCWFAENCRYLPFVSPPEVGSEDDNMPHAYVQGYTGNSIVDAASSDNYNTYGALYNFDAVIQWTLCPSGWSVSSNSDWDELAAFTGGYDIGGGALKTIGTLESNTGLWTFPNTGATNSTGFGGIPGGGRYPEGPDLETFDNFWLYANFWITTEAPSDKAWAKNLPYNNAKISNNTLPRSYGRSARCIKDPE